MTCCSVVMVRLVGGTRASLLTPVTPASDPPGPMTGNSVCAEFSATWLMKSATVSQVAPMSGSGVMTSRTRSPASAAVEVLVAASAVAALMTNMPIKASHSPSASPQNSSSATPAAISTAPSTRPAAAADWVARARSPCRIHRTARRIRPPSSGAPGSRLKTVCGRQSAGCEPAHPAGFVWENFAQLPFREEELIARAPVSGDDVPAALGGPPILGPRMSRTSSRGSWTPPCAPARL